MYKSKFQNSEIHDTRVIAPAGLLATLLRKKGLIFTCLPYCFCKVALLITDGIQTSGLRPNEPTPRLVADAMKRRGIEIQAIGIGAADPVELWGYASDPNLVLKADDFSKLEDIVIMTANNLCPRKLSQRSIVNNLNRIIPYSTACLRATLGLEFLIGS